MQHTVTLVYGAHINLRVYKACSATDMELDPPTVSHDDTVIHGRGAHSPHGLTGEIYMFIETLHYLTTLNYTL